MFPKTTVQQKKIKTINTLTEQFLGEILFGKSPLQMQMCTIALLKNLLHLMNSYNYYCEIAN